MPRYNWHWSIELKNPSEGLGFWCALRVPSVTIAFPSISTGAYAFPPAEAAVIATGAIREFLSAAGQEIAVRLVFLDRAAAEIFIRQQSF